MRFWERNKTGMDRLNSLLKDNNINPKYYSLPDGPILDLGCSQGYTSKEISRLFKRDVIGIDTELELIAFAKKYNQTDKVKFHCMDGCNLKEELPGPYSAIFAMNNLAFGLIFDIITKEEFSGIVRTLKDCLVPNGHLIINYYAYLWIYENGKDFVYKSKIPKKFTKPIEDLILFA